MGGGGFGGVVAEVRLRVADHAGHAADDDDGTGLGFGCGGEEGQEGEGAEVDGCDVGGVRFVPVVDGFGPELRFHLSGVGCVRVAFGAGDSCGGDKKGEVFLFGFYLGDEVLEVLFGGDVAGADGDDLTVEMGVGGAGRVGFRGISEDFHAAACNIDFGSWREVSGES